MKTPFVLVSTHYGPMIVNRLDTGVSWQLFETGGHESEVVSFGLDLSAACRDIYGVGVQIFDIGANIGTCTIPWARYCRDWGNIVAFEPQEPIYYALAGNIALNNLFNVRAIRGVVSDGTTPNTFIPKVNYEVSSNFGGIAMKDGLLRHSPGQILSYEKDSMKITPAYSIDALYPTRADIIKIDVEGMEIDVLTGATNAIKRLRPVLITEWIHCGTEAITEVLPDFEHFSLEGNTISVHKDEKLILEFVRSKLK
jgi:FkbM family methyltransferase